jgi:hypothetical protein
MWQIGAVLVERAGVSYIVSLTGYAAAVRDEILPLLGCLSAAGLLVCCMAGPADPNITNVCGCEALASLGVPDKLSTLSGMPYMLSKQL